MPEYRNPILPFDLSDPDAIRVGDDYYLTASTFNRVPGLPVLHSRDLVHWGIVGHALPRLVPDEHFALPRHGGGVWAPALRHHAGRFHLVFPDPDHGIYVTTATDAAGPWSPPHLLSAGRGLIDPCPFWDDDGRAYLVHGWATTRAGVNNVLTMHEMAPDASRLLGPGRVVVDGGAIPGFSVLEGPKLHRRGDDYWIFAPAGGVPDGWQSVFRARSVWGPYEERTVLVRGSAGTNGPHQGAWVEGADGRDWFLHFQERPPHGRIVHLQPMSWGDDGWPRMGTNWDGSRGDGPGEPVDGHEAPGGPADGWRGEPLDGGGDWRGGIGPQWYWQANPEPGWASTAPDGTLSLLAVPDDPVNLRELPHVLARRLPAEACEATVAVELDRDAPPGTRAGAVVLGLRYCWWGLLRTPAGVVVTGGHGGEGRAERPLGTPFPLPETSRVELRLAADAAGRVTFSWRPAGGDWAPAAGRFQAGPGFWVGADVGVFATSPLGAAPSRVRFGPFALVRDGGRDRG